MILTEKEINKISGGSVDYFDRIVFARAIESALLEKLRGGVEVPKQAVKLYDVLGQTVEVHGYTLPQLLAYGDARALAAREQDRVDAERYRWLTDDHADAEMRDRAEYIGIRLRWICKGAADATIDAAMLAASPREQT